MGCPTARAGSPLSVQGKPRQSLLKPVLMMAKHHCGKLSEIKKIERKLLFLGRFRDPLCKTLLRPKPDSNSK